MTRPERHRRLVAGLLAVFALVIVGTAPVLAAAKANNVIVLIADGRLGADKSDPANPVVKIDYRGSAAELPVNTNFLKLGERMFALAGVVVYAPATGRAYIPLQAVQMIRGDKAALPGIAR
jgi:hypothetical protein